MPNSSFPIYSPTQTMQWMGCRRKWQLERLGWEASFLEWNPAAAVGSAVHAGWAVFNKGGTDAAMEDAVLGSLVSDYQQNDAYSLETLSSLSTQGVVAASAERSEGKVLAAEEPMYGCIIDCVSEEEGALVITELKTSFKWDDRAYWFPKQWEARKKEYEHSWQLLHEAWATEAHFQRPVHTLRVVHVGLTPRVWVRVHAWPLDLLLIHRWLEYSAKPVWEAMSRDRQHYLQPYMGYPPAPMNPLRCGDYGGCQFQKLCWGFAGDLEKAKGFYALRDVSPDGKKETP